MVLTLVDPEDTWGPRNAILELNLSIFFSFFYILVGLKINVESSW